MMSNRQTDRLTDRWFKKVHLQTGGLITNQCLGFFIKDFSWVIKLNALYDENE